MRAEDANFQYFSLLKKLFKFKELQIPLKSYEKKIICNPAQKNDASKMQSAASTESALTADIQFRSHSPN
jgi:hypothetical protein